MSCVECKTALDPFQSLWDNVLAQRVPVAATLELTPRCNFSCVHCFCVVEPGRKSEEMTTAEWKSTLDQLAAAGTLTATFTGGDPFVRPDFLELAEYARAQRFAVRILTNASFITRKNIDRVAALKPLQVSISLYGSTPETYEAVTGQPRFFDKAVRGIDLLIAAGVPIELKFPLLRENFHERAEMIAFAERRGVAWRADVEMTPKDNGDVSPLAHALTDPDLLVWAQELSTPLPTRETFASDDKLCQPGVFSLVVGPYGDIYPCMQIKSSMGNLRELKFTQIWEDSPDLAQVRSLRAGDFGGCNDCSHFGPCKPCPGVSLIHSGSLTAPTQTTCRITGARASLPILSETAR